MREVHSHDVLGALVIEHRLQPRLSCIKWQTVPAPLHCIENVLYEVAADVEALSVENVICRRWRANW